MENVKCADWLLSRAVLNLLIAAAVNWRIHLALSKENLHGPRVAARSWVFKPQKHIIPIKFMPTHAQLNSKFNPHLMKADAADSLKMIPGLLSGGAYFDAM
jgi:hypothetical protein